MPVPPIPPPFESLGQRPFSFYPAILNVDHNQWRFVRATWSELVVANTLTSDELWIPRRYVGELSRIDAPTMILGLTRELEYNAGQVVPHSRRVIEIPRAVNDIVPGRSVDPVAPAPVVGIRLERGGTDSRIGKLVMGAMAVGIVVCVLVVAFLRGDRDGSRVTYAPVLQSTLDLTAQDDYNSVVHKLGPPAEDRWRSEAGERQYRVLRYPSHRISVILMGATRNSALYIGSLNQDWKPVHSITLPGGGSTYPMLRSLEKF